MKQTKNSLTLFLITSSIVLLLVLETFWLHSAYQHEFDQLKRETNFLFRTTVIALQDSLIRRNIKPLRGDTLLRAPGHPEIIDLKGRLHSDNIQVFINGPAGPDSMKALFYNPVIRRLKQGGGQHAFAIKIGSDSISTTDIEHSFRSALHRADIDLAFKINELAPHNRNPHASRFELTTEWVPTITSSQFEARFGNVQTDLLKRIAPQILFSLFLSSLTIVSFVFMYRSIRSQQRLMEQKNDFISNVTHELKTPIATVSVALEALKDFRGIENPKLTLEYLDIARHELDRLSTLTDKVLTTALFDEHGIKIDFEKVDLAKSLEEVLHSMSLVFEKQTATARVEKTGSDFVVYGSQVHLTNVICNLLDNALKYSPANPDVIVSLGDLGSRVSLSVTDNGLGIPQDFHKKIFEKFFRMPTGDVHNIKGYGLGLSYVDSVVKSHKGTIEVKSEVGKGSTFRIDLPKT